MTRADFAASYRAALTTFGVLGALMGALAVLLLCLHTGALLAAAANGA